MLAGLAACAPKPVSEPEPAAENAPVGPGTRRMIERLALLADQARQDPHPFMNRERAARFERFEPPTDPVARFEAEVRLARELLWAGRTEDALKRLEDLRSALGTEGLGANAERVLTTWLATAYLRRGEEQNCIDHHGAEAHGAEACLFPIQGGGVHRQQDPSRAALAELDRQLRLDPDDLEARWLYNIAAMTLGEYPASVPDEWLVPPGVFASEHDLERFPDRAPATGVAASGLAGGSVLEDFDGDGDLDLMVSSWGIDDPLRYFENSGDGTFEERTAEVGLEGLTGGLNLIHADYDNDGRPDVLVLRGAWLVRDGRQPNSLLRNQAVEDGSVFFEDVTEAAGLLTFRPTQTAAWGDFDNDGWLDLFVGNESFPGISYPCQLFRSHGPGDGGEVSFTDIAAEAGVAAGGVVKGVAAGDFDNDGWLDLYLSRLLEPNLLFRNLGAETASGPRFLEIGEVAGVGEPLHSFPTWFFDFDNDGWLDLFVAGYAGDYASTGAAPVAADLLGLPHDGETPRLYRNRGDGTFHDVTGAAGLDRVLLAMGSNFGDLDNDGFPDFYLGTGAPSFRTLIANRMFRNDGGRRFQDVTTAGGFGHLQKGHGVSFGDIDGDGDQDVYAVIGGAYTGDVYPNVLFTNPGHGRSWVTLRLEGTAANRSAIGARVRITVEEPAGVREIHAVVGTGGSFGSSSLQQEIGLGSGTRIESLEIRWPGSGGLPGAVQRMQNLPVERVLRIREGDPEPYV